MPTRQITETWDEIIDGRLRQVVKHRAQLIVGGLHCQSCGTTDNESLTTGDQGYTACCNEIAVDECTERWCYHA